MSKQTFISLIGLFFHLFWGRKCGKPWGILHRDHRNAYSRSCSCAPGTLSTWSCSRLSSGIPVWGLSHKSSTAANRVLCCNAVPINNFLELTGCVRALRTSLLAIAQQKDGVMQTQATSKHAVIPNFWTILAELWQNNDNSDVAGEHDLKFLLWNRS